MSLQFFKVLMMSEYFEWNVSTYGIQVRRLDREHEILIGYMNELHALYLSGATRAAVARGAGESRRVYA